MRKKHALIEKAKEHKMAIGIAVGAVGTAATFGIAYKMGEENVAYRIEAMLQRCANDGLLHLTIPKREGCNVVFDDVVSWTDAAIEYYKSK